ncbi:hypothetical protein KKH13_00450 [Patescibacteria group bacterium]|nr:hypothetical protein [Patescibacteria group bacterium]
MPNPEIFQAATNLVHQAKELIDVGARNNLLQTLTELGHPYGLLIQPLLDQPSISVRSSDSEISQQIISPPLSSISERVSVPATDFYSNIIHDSAVFIWGDRKYNKSGSSYESSLIGSSLFSSIDPEGVSAIVAEPLYLSFASIYVSGNESSGSVKSSSQGVEKSSTTLKRSSFFINKNCLGLGAVSLNVSRFRGHEPFVVKPSQGEPLAEIKPQEPLAFLHLNRQAGVLRQMSPMERIQKMTRDLKEVFGLIDSESLFNSLNPEQ